ncbi:MAG: hypothetical protein WA103_00510 [Minisyncoccales bacterium]
MIIFINGSINAGKSTVAKILARKIGNTALVEVDILGDMIDWMPIDQAVQINLQNAVSIIKNFIEKKMNVIVPYPLSQKNYDYLKKGLANIDPKMYFFTLAPKLDTILTNRGNRKLNDWERDRIKYHYEIGIQKPLFGESIDNTGQTPEETADLIYAMIFC